MDGPERSDGASGAGSAIDASAPAASAFNLDTAAAARSLAAIGDQPEDVVDAFFERVEEVRFASGGGAAGNSAVRSGGGGAGLAILREEGLAVRLVRAGRTWLASRDQLSGRGFAEAARSVARVQPRAALPEPALDPGPWPHPEAPELAEFERALERALRARLVAFPLRLAITRHTRHVQVVGPRLVPPAERERFWSVLAEMAWGRMGALYPALDTAPDSFADLLVAHFRARAAGAPEASRGPVVLGPAAAAVFLHEAVAHALEADLLAQSGQPSAALGVALGAACLDVLDDPAGAPAGVRRTTDDEGQPVLRRWLLRGGVVEQPLADVVWAASSAALAPGAGRRANRHVAPGPRSTHLELVGGSGSEQDLIAATDGGWYLAHASRGSLDPRTGFFRLQFDCGQRIRGGQAGDLVGACTLSGRLADLLHQISAVAGTGVAGGAGWCAKGGQKLPVWATAPALRLDNVEVSPA